MKIRSASVILTLGLCGCATGPNQLWSAAGSGGASGATSAAQSGSGAVDASIPDASLDNTVALVPVPLPADASVFDAQAQTCGASSYAAQQVVVQTEVQVATQVVTQKPVALYIMFDQSLSMALSNLWNPAVTAIKSFVADDKSAGVGVGIQYFPLSGGSCSTGAKYSTPEVDVGTLPGQASAIDASLDSHSPNGLNTPLEGALRGVTQFCENYQTQHSDTQCVAVLVTDGKPELAAGCSQDTTYLAGIAQAAHAAGVTTFAVGLNGADFSVLDAIAMAGGAPDCDPNASTYACDVSSGADKLRDALNSIRDSVVTTETHTEIMNQVQQMALPCEWSIPATSDGSPFDPDKVNVRMHENGADTTLVRVSSADACQDNAWHYDDPTSPKSLIACPSVCDAIKAASDAKIDVLLGCATLTPQ